MGLGIRNGAYLILYDKYNGFHYIKNVNQTKIICNMIAEFLYNTWTHSKTLRNTVESQVVNDEKYKVLNMPDNKDLYPNLNNETIEYIKNFDPQKEFMPSVRLTVDTKHENFSLLKMDISECDEAFEKFLKVYKALIKKNSVVVKNSSNKYHTTTTEYRVDLHFNT